MERINAGAPHSVKILSRRFEAMVVVTAGQGKAKGKRENLAITTRKYLFQVAADTGPLKSMGMRSIGRIAVINCSLSWRKDCGVT